MFNRLKKAVAAVVATTVVMAMGVVTAFAAEPLDEGEYTVTPTLYKESTCENVSMGNDALVGATVYVQGDTATLELNTKDLTVTRLGITVTGKLKTMTLYDNAGNEYKADPDGYTFTVSGIPASQIVEGVSFKSTFEASVSIIPVDMTGYLKLTNFTLAE